MDRKNLFIVTASLIVIAVLVVLYDSISAEPVEAISQKWHESGHADRTSESFVHWNEDEPPLIPQNCAKCHSTYGYLDFLGEDDTTVGTVDTEAETGSVIFCNVCHNESAHDMTLVTFPSGDEVTEVGSTASCLQCHQGRQSTVSVNEAIAGLPDDQVSEDLGFINVHYYVAAATKMGSEVRGAYEYADRGYAGFFEHAAKLRWCPECHDPHSLDITPDECSPCHLNVVDYGDLADIRASQTDYDGDGDVGEGVDGEIETLHEALYGAIQDYASTVLEAPIVYAPDSFPYFMNDTNGNGEADPEEVSGGNRYARWTPRLVRTTYNYHFVQKDPGAFAHNPEYIVQILQDSLADLSKVVAVDMAAFIRPPQASEAN